jgi:hypothetical protein
VLHQLRVFGSASQRLLLLEVLHEVLQVLQQRPETDVMIFKIFLPNKITKNWRFLLEPKLNYANI